MASLYHYTDMQGATGILRDKRINISTRATDANFGEGVYLTAMPPFFGQQRIIDNNYDSAVRLRQNPRLFQRASFYFRMATEDLGAVFRVPTNKRDVWLFPGPITFGQVRWEYGSTPASVFQPQQWGTWRHDGPRGPTVASQWYLDRNIVPARYSQW